MPVPGAFTEAIVEERRAEAILTYGRPLSPTLTLQAAAGAEYSELTQTGAGGLSRQFFRPKGFLNLAWRPNPNLDVSARIERVVGQLNFFDFVASSNVSAGTSNAGNANLVPPQRWNGQIQVRRNLGPWGTVTGRLYGSLITDIVDVIPIGATGQSPGNLDGTATLYGLQVTSTINFDPIGWRGAKIDANLQFQRTSLEDPLTGVRRPFNETMTRQIEIDAAPRHPEHAMGLGRHRLPVSPIGRLPARPALPLPRHAGQPRRLRRAQGRVRADRARQRRQSARHQRELQPHLLQRPPHRDRFSNLPFTEDRDRFYGPIFTLVDLGHDLGVRLGSRRRPPI